MGQGALVIEEEGFCSLLEMWPIFVMAHESLGVDSRNNCHKSQGQVSFKNSIPTLFLSLLRHTWTS